MAVNAQPSETVKQVPPSPQLQLLAICIVQLNEALQITMPYTVAVYMIRDFQSQQPNKADDEVAIGRLTGLLVACFSAAQLISSFPWGRISDCVGRKPVIVMSTFTSCFCDIGFGLSTNFAMAAAFRIFQGIFNCTIIWGLIWNRSLKCMIGESYDVEGQAKPVSYLTICWGIGVVIGPALGSLANPCETFANDMKLCSPGSILHARPFLLPCLVTSLAALTAMLTTIFLMAETLPKLAVNVSREANPLMRQNSSLDTEARDCSIACQPDVEMVPLLDFAAKHTDIADESKGLEKFGSLNRETDAKVEHEGLLQKGAEFARSERRNGRNFAKWWRSRSLRLLGQRNRPLAAAAKPPEKPSYKPPAAIFIAADPESVTPLTIAGAPDKFSFQAEDAARTSLPLAAADPSSVVWYKDRQVVLAIATFGFIALLFSMMDETVPMFSSASSADGGLELSTAALSAALAIGGVSIFVCALALYPMLQRRLGPLKACRLGLLASIPCCLGLGLPSVFPLHPSWQQAALAVALLFKGAAVTLAFTSIVVVVSAAAPRAAMGAVHGTSQAVAALVRALGPALAGLLWGVSVTIHVTGHELLPFFFTATAFTIPLVITSFIDGEAWRKQCTSCQ